MKELTKQLRELEQKAAALEPSEQQRNHLLEEVRDYSHSYLNELSEAPAFSSGKSTGETFRISGNNKSMKEILELFDKEMANKGIRASSGGHLGYIPGGGLYASALGDYLAAITNEYSGLSYASPGAVAMEQELLNWLKEVFRFPDSAVGNLTSGGSIANMIALTAARDKHKVKGAEIEKCVVYVSPQVHHSNTKALRILGLEDVIVRYLELDEFSRIHVVSLSEQIKSDKTSGLRPFLLIGSAGTTDTGAVDPFKELAGVAQEHDLWFHVDAAYGGFFILAEERDELFEGIELVDSLSVDPHKGLFVPYGLGAVLVKDKEAVFHSHHHSANYMQDAKLGQEMPDPADLSPELTKHFRAMRLWLPLQLHGVEPFVASLKEKLLLVQYFRKRMQALGFALGPEPDLSITYFWWPVAEGDENAFNRNLMKKLHEDGRVFLSSTIIGERFVIRLAVLSFRTNLDTIEKAIEAILEAKG